MVRKLKCGIIGFGYMGEIRRCVIEEHPDLELVGICDPDSTKRGAVQGCPTFESFHQLLEKDLDAVFVCAPNRYAPEICIQSLKKGKHVFCEKPPGRDKQDILNIIQAEHPPLKLMFGFNHRFHPGIVRAKILVDSGRYGKILSMRGVYGKSGGSRFRESWRNNKEISGGGILLDQGIHMLDLFRHFCGDFEWIKCFASNIFWGFDIEDNAFVLLQNKKGQTASLHSSATLWKHTFQLNIILENAYLVVEGFLSKTGSYGREKLIVGKREFEDETEALGNPSEEVTYFDKDISWTMEVQEFVRSIQENRPVVHSSSKDALAAMEIVEKAYQDAKLNSKDERPL